MVRAQAQGQGFFCGIQRMGYSSFTWSSNSTGHQSLYPIGRYGCRSSILSSERTVHPPLCSIGCNICSNSVWSSDSTAVEAPPGALTILFIRHCVLLDVTYVATPSGAPTVPLLKLHLELWQYHPSAIVFYLMCCM